MDIFHPLPPVAAAAILYLLTCVGQVRELYLSYMEEPNVGHILWAVLGFGALSASLYSSHYGLSTIRQNIIFRNFVRPNIGINFRRLRKFSGLAWSLAPWCGLAIGMCLASLHIERTHEQLNQTTNASGMAAFAKPAFGPLSLSVALGLIIAAALVTAVLLNVSRRSRSAPWIVVSLTMVLIVSAVIVPLFWDEISFYRFLGPLATLALVILFVFSILALLALMSQKSGFPVLTFVAMCVAVGWLLNLSFGEMALWFGILCAVLALFALFARLNWHAGVVALLSLLAFFSWSREASLTGELERRQPSMERQEAALPPALEHQFRAWLTELLKSEEATPGSRLPHPVFIIAVEGGGIYAASAAALLLARLQDDSPNFARHVFAISGVSGGAIGATIFQALWRQSIKGGASAEATECEEHVKKHMWPTDRGLAKRISKVVLDDHFSPILGAIIPDFPGTRMERAATLEKSFWQSVHSCDSDAAETLNHGYRSHWSGGGPALVLNATWAETGHRVAFAPFRLKGSGDGTLYSFSDQNMPGDDITLLRAAVVSARFPIILPPYSVRRPAVEPSQSGVGAPASATKKKAAPKGDHRWNFVDGGYADTSGAATALDLYRALEQVLGKDEYKEQKDKVDLKIILLTSAEQTPDFAGIHGTSLRDTIVPIGAVLKVRERLGKQAVGRVCDYFRRADCKSKGERWKLGVIKLEDEAYSLPLGWKISKTTFRLVSALLGNPENCSKKPERQPAPIMHDNSCVLHAIQQALLRTF
jgi:hypothetical protein